MSHSKVTTLPSSSSRVGCRLPTACPMEPKTSLKSRLAEQSTAPDNVLALVHGKMACLSFNSTVSAVAALCVMSGSKVLVSTLAKFTAAHVLSDITSRCAHAGDE